MVSISTVLYQNYNYILYGDNNFDGHGILRNLTLEAGLKQSH